MKPYYTDDLITLYCADNREAPWPDTADLILTDPPYSDVTHHGARSHADWDVSGGNEAPPLGIAFDSLSEADLHFYFDRFGAIARRWVISFLDWRHTALLERDPPDTLRFVRFGLWAKDNPAPQFTGDRPAQGWESIAMLHKAGSAMRWNGGGKSSVYRFPVAHHTARLSANVTAKPFGLIRQLILDFSDTGDLIFDPFLGSGTTAAVAASLKRRVIGIERRETECAALVYWLKHNKPHRHGTAALNDLPMFTQEETV